MGGVVDWVSINAAAAKLRHDAKSVQGFAPQWERFSIACGFFGGFPKDCFLRCVIAPNGVGDAIQHSIKRWNEAAHFLPHIADEDDATQTDCGHGNRNHGCGDAVNHLLSFRKLEGLTQLSALKLPKGNALLYNGVRSLARDVLTPV